MPTAHESPLGTKVADHPVSYTERDSVLYALALGFGSDLAETRELPFVLDGAQKTLPTMASILDETPPGLSARRAGFALELYRPLPPAAELLASRRVIAARERPGETELVLRTETRMARDDTALFALDGIVLTEGGRAAGAPGAAGLAPHPIPGRRPDLSCEIGTRPEQALLFRLAASPTQPPAAPGPRAFDPFLDGRCACGIACRAILRTICDYDYTLIRGFAARYAAPMAAGETVRTDMWQERNVVSFRCSAAGGDRRVLLDHGYCLLAA